MISGGDHKTLYPQGNGPGDYFLNNKFEIDCDDDFIIISVRMYKFFMANGKEGLDAKQLYEHLIFASRVQGSKKVKANLNYIKNGLGWGDAKIKKARRFLSVSGLIEFEQKVSDSGQFAEKKIVIKRSWDVDALRAWYEKKSNKENTGGSEIEPPVEPEQTGGSKTEPVEDIAYSENEDTIYPEVHLPNIRSTERSVSSDNYKGSYKKEILPQEQESKESTQPVDNSDSRETSSPPLVTSPPAAGITSLTTMKTFLISMVKERDPSSFFYFTPKESEQIGIAYTRFGSERLMEIFQEYLTGKTPSQVNKFHGEDIPQFLKRAMKKDKSVKSVKTSKEPTPHHCPVCGKMWSASSTLSMCPQCGMELSDFENHQEIKEHREWWESTPHNRNQAAG